MNTHKMKKVFKHKISFCFAHIGGETTSEVYDLLDKHFYTLNVETKAEDSLLNKIGAEYSGSWYYNSINEAGVLFYTDKPLVSKDARNELINFVESQRTSKVFNFKVFDIESSETEQVVL